MYKHHDITGTPIDLPVGKVVCVGRNYQDHIDELRNEVPTEPLLFMKPSAALCDMQSPIQIPAGLGECHNELEVAVLITRRLHNACPEQAKKSAAWIGLGLDLTLRDVQNALKQKGHPWERAKAFDRSAPVSPFVRADELTNLDDIHFTLSVNGHLRQSGHTQLMLHNIVALVSHISQVFSLAPGDVVLTGTPKGVGPLCPGDTIEVSLEDKLRLSSVVKTHE